MSETTDRSEANAGQEVAGSERGGVFSLGARELRLSNEPHTAGVQFDQQSAATAQRFLAWVLGVFVCITGQAQTLIVDPAFAPIVTGAVPSVVALLIQPDGRILIGGTFANVNGKAHANITRLNPDGSLDPEFDPALQVDGSVDSLALQSDGKITVGGGPGLSGFAHVDGVARTNLARLNADGTLDTTFALGTNGVDGSVQALAIQEDGKVIIGGVFDRVDNTFQADIARLNSDGSVDGTFAPPRTISSPDYLGGVLALAIQGDGKILAGGDFYLLAGNIIYTNIARFNADGTVDPTFNPTIGLDSTRVDALAIQPDGKILIAGRFQEITGTQQNNVARLNSDGSIDASFNANSNPWGGFPDIRTVLVETNGTIMVGGYFGYVDIPGPYTLVRLRSDGIADTTFDVPSDIELDTAALRSDGGLVIAGFFRAVNNLPRYSIAAFMPASGIPPPTLSSALLQADGRVSMLITNLVSGFTYRLEASHQLPVWSFVTNFLASATSAATTNSPLAPDHSSFYRVVIP